MNMPSKMLLIVLCIDAFLFLGMTAVNNLNPDNDLNNALNSHLINKFNINTQGGYELQSANATIMEQYFPGAQEGIAGTDTQAFPDIFNSIRSWIFQVTGLNYILQVVGAPYYFLKAILPGIEYEVIVYTIGALWYAFSLFAIIAWALGRE